MCLSKHLRFCVSLRLSPKALTPPPSRPTQLGPQHQEMRRCSYFTRVLKATGTSHHCLGVLGTWLGPEQTRHPSSKRGLTQESTLLSCLDPSDEFRPAQAPGTPIAALDGEVGGETLATALLFFVFISCRCGMSGVHS